VADQPPIPFRILVGALAVITAIVIAVQMTHSKGAPTRTPSSPAPASGAAATDPSVPPLPDCRKGEQETALTSYDDWPETLVDTHFSLPHDYQPPDLQPVSKAGLSGDYQVRRFVLGDLKALGAAADAAGNPLGIVAADRDYATQQKLYDERVAQFGRDAAQARTARPGHSEHQLGVAIDFRSADASDVDQNWDQTPAGSWMAEHAAEYGFVLSYPKHDEDITCYTYEPWHYRYFGPKRAALINASGLTVREYLWAEQQGA
jgi:D-alanyl-D-alanine carboxypeptidase